MLYAIQAGGDDGPIKLGYAVEPRSRLVELQVGNHERLELVSVRRGTLRDEAALHKRFWEARIRGEWFNATAELLEEVLAWDASPVWRGLPISQYEVRRAVLCELASEADARELWCLDVAYLSRPRSHCRDTRTESEARAQAEKTAASNLRCFCDQYAAEERERVYRLFGVVDMPLLGDVPSVDELRQWAAEQS